jgi:hypothetical protein
LSLSFSQLFCHKWQEKWICVSTLKASRTNNEYVILLSRPPERMKPAEALTFVQYIWFQISDSQKY